MTNSHIKTVFDNMRLGSEKERESILMQGLQVSSENTKTKIKTWTSHDTKYHELHKELGKEDL